MDDDRAVFRTGPRQSRKRDGREQLIRWRAIAAAFVAAGLATGSAAAPQSAPVTDPAQAEAPADDVVVIGNNGKGYRLTADALRDAAKAFVENRAAFAPAARLFFAVRALAPERRATLGLYLRDRKAAPDGHHRTIPLALDAANRFEVPVETLVAGDWDLRADRSGPDFRIEPLVLSPASTLEDRRLGDLRLQCHVSIAFIRISAPLRLMVSALHPCSNKSFKFYVRPARPLRDARVEEAGRPPLAVLRHQFSYAVPIADRRIGNEARLRLGYLPGEPRPPAPQ